MTLRQPEHKIKALLVDDDRTTREMSAIAATRMGFSITMAESGEQAIKYFKKKQFDVIFMDIEMPEMDGFETTRRIRELEGEAASTHIIALSGNIRNENIVHQCIEHGMNDCIAKPLREVSLKERSKKWNLKTA